jgi:hypothetical protein
VPPNSYVRGYRGYLGDLSLLDWFISQVVEWLIGVGLLVVKEMLRLSV